MYSIDVRFFLCSSTHIWDSIWSSRQQRQHYYAHFEHTLKWNKVIKFGSFLSLFCLCYFMHIGFLMRSNPCDVVILPATRLLDFNLVDFVTQCIRVCAAQSLHGFWYLAEYLNFMCYFKLNPSKSIHSLSKWMEKCMGKKQTYRYIWVRLFEWVRRNILV